MLDENISFSIFRASDSKQIKRHWNWTCHRLATLCTTNICSAHAEYTDIFWNIGGVARSRLSNCAASRIHYVTSLSLLQTRRKAAEWIFISNEDTGAHKEKFPLVLTPSASPLAGFSGSAEAALAIQLFRPFCVSEFHSPLINAIIKLLRNFLLVFISDEVFQV